MKLNIKVDIKAIPHFFTLLQEGVTIKGNVGMSVRDTIKGHLGITDEYIDKKISTVLLDGSVVDDMDRAVIKEGSVLALSGAMPGLVGATMRTHSLYASFRNAITYKEKQKTFIAKKGTFKIKLFNLLLKDLGPGLLKRGILVEPKRVGQMLKAQSERPTMYFKGITIDGVPSDLDGLNKRLLDDDRSIIELTVDSI